MSPRPLVKLLPGAFLSSKMFSNFAGDVPTLSSPGILLVSMPREAPQPPSITDSNGLSGRFETEATSTLRELRRATASLIASFKGVDRAIEVSTRLGLERSLAWKVWQVAQGTSACPSVAHIPGRQGFKRFLEAAQQAGVNHELVRDAQAAFDKFEQLTVAYGGGRASAGSLLGTLSAEGRTRHETALRRDGFRANAAFLGVQAAAMYQLDVLWPRDPTSPPDVLRVRGHFGLRRNRANVPWMLCRSTLVNAAGPSKDLMRTPLSPMASISTDDVQLPMILPEFSSRPLPPVQRRVVAGVTIEDELLPGPVGQADAVDVVTGERVVQFGTRNDHVDAVTMSVSTPCERLCYEIVAPQGLLTDGPTLRVHSTVQTEHPYLRGPEFNTIPVTEAFEDLGLAIEAPPASEVPRHTEILRWTLRQAEHVAGSMRIWRVRMRFPPLPSCLAASYRLAVGA